MEVVPVPGHVVGLEFHAHPLSDVSLDPNIVEQACHHAECRLDPGRPWGGQEPVISVEKPERVRNSHTNSYGTDKFPDTTVAQCRITVSTNISNIVRYSGSPYVTPLVLVKRST